MTSVQPASVRANQDLVVFGHTMAEDEYFRLERNGTGIFKEDPHLRNANYYKGTVEPQVNSMMSDYALAKSALNIAISEASAAGDYGKVAELRTAARKLETTYAQITDNPPGLGTGDKANFASRWESRLDDFQDAIYSGIAVADSVTPKVEAAPLNLGLGMGRVPSPEVRMMDLSSSAAASKTDGSSKAEGSAEATEAGKTIADLDMDVDQMVDLLSRDPAALMDKLSELDPNSKNTLLSVVQGRLQEMNRMFSMMSNMQKSIHDTMKAAINNMRV